MASSPKFYDRVLETTSVTSTTSPLTLLGAVTGYQTWAAVGNGNSAQYCIEGVDGSGVPTGEWEVGIGTYTSSGTTLSRTSILASSNSGSIVTFSAGTKRVHLVQPVAATAMTPIGDMGGRLTLTTGVPVTTSDVTAATSLFYTPYKHNRVELWNGSGWVRYAFSEITLATPSLTSTLPYDIYLYDNAGTLTLEPLAWTDAANRATNIVQQDGVWCKTGVLTRRLVGTIFPSATDQMSDSLAHRGVSNVDNAVSRPIFICPGYSNNNANNSYTTTSSTWAAANSGTGATATYVFTLPSGVNATMCAMCGDDNAQSQAAFGIGDSTTSTASVMGFSSVQLTQVGNPSVTWAAAKAAGKYSLSMLIATVVNTKSVTFYADLGRIGGASIDQACTTLTATIQG